MIEKIYIENYKSFEKLEVIFNEEMNIIVGDNESGKSTILEAVNLALSHRLNGRPMSSEISPFIFNTNTVEAYVSSLRSGGNPKLPEILIEIYLKDEEKFAGLKGDNNSKREDKPGLKVLIAYKDEYAKEYENFKSDPTKIKSLPVEYYESNWLSFSDDRISSRSAPIDVSYIDATTLNLQSGVDYYLQSIINGGLSEKERAELALEYRSLKDDFSNKPAIAGINAALLMDKGNLTDKEFTVSIDISQRSGWDTSLTPYLDTLPFRFVGKGEQNTLKILLALHKSQDKAGIILIEEPENHLSYSTMRKLIKKINEKCEGKQIIITTHSAYVLNKLGLENLILLANSQTVALTDLTKSTQRYFKRLPGYDTLRVVLSEESVLVEGPSDELIVQRAYADNHDGKMPLDDGIDIINVRGLSFKRFLEIGVRLDKQISVITDNDGDYNQNITEKYKDFLGFKNVLISADTDENYRTIEPQMLKVNGLEKMNKILNKAYTTEAELIEYMTTDSNKTNVALRLFETEELLEFPEYILNVFK